MENYTYYTPYAINEILSQNPSPVFVKKDGNYIMNEAVSFDIEVTSTYNDENQKIAFMYVWMLDIFDKTIVGRTWEDFVDTIQTISNYYGLNGIKKRLICYVHSLAYEFQFIRKWFEWVKVFSLSKRKPLYALTTNGIEFRCSYRLTGYKLSKIGEQVGIEKLPDFNYREIRHSKTPLSPREYQYCVHDVKIVSELIRRKIKEENNNIANIPLTKTGYVRRYVRNHTIRGNNRTFYKNAIKEMTLEPDEYIMAKNAFAGGFTHASRLHSSLFNSKTKTFKSEILENVTSLDFSSSYPSVLVAEKFPMTKGKKIFPNWEEFQMLMENEECCMFRIELKDVRQKFPCEAYISFSKCIVAENTVLNNGRIVSADRIIIDITTLDYNIIQKVYKCTPTRIGDCYYYEKFYLPTSFIECVLYFYNAKTQLKGVKGKEVEFMNGKENLNALFGMCVTDIVRDEILYENGWLEIESKTPQEFYEYVSNQLDKENYKKSRFLFYMWGVWCTAYARRNLWSGILECKSDYIYSDTDSVKITRYEKHKEYFERYNKEVTSKLEAALTYHKLPLELIRPKNIKGTVKSLGVWEIDGRYMKFKAIRAKSYMYLDDEGYHMTVAGLGKENAIEYLKTIGDPLQLFEYGLKIPAEYKVYNKQTKKYEIKSGTGKLTHTYVDEPFTAKVYDLNDVPCMVHERSCIHLEPADYHMSLGRALIDYMRGVERDVYE